MHENKVVHADLKCANVLVDYDGKVKLTDFGCSRLFDSSFSSMELTSTVNGSLSWMAPEVIKNKGRRRKSDIWSLGCVIVEMA